MLDYGLYYPTQEVKESSQIEELRLDEFNVELATDLLWDMELGLNVITVLDNQEGHVCCVCECSKAAAAEPNAAYSVRCFRINISTS